MESARTATGTATPSRTRRGPIAWLLKLFSSVWLGVTLLLLLFVYSSIGSAGLPTGEGILKPPFFLRPDAWVTVRAEFEMSEFQWFHWWPFDVLIGLICLNIIVATLRRIPFKVVNLGVWMIHTGIIMLALGSVWYFGTKVEGDAPVVRRQIVASLPGQEPVRFIAAPGNGIRVGSGMDVYTLQVQGITPDWELLSGDDAGKRAYKVSVLVQHAGETYIRELLAGYPEYTEDLVQSQGGPQPFERAKKKLGTPLVDETLSLTLDYAPQDEFYLMETAAIYVRELGATEWVERPIRRLPRYADHITSHDSVWHDGEAELPPLNPLEIEVPPGGPNDPLPDTTFHISDYLRYALMQSGRVADGGALDPVLTVRISNAAGQSQVAEMVARDPSRNNLGGGLIEFHWVNSEDALAALRGSSPPRLHADLAAEGLHVDLPIEIVGTGENAPFTPIAGSDYEYRVRSAEDGLVIDGRRLSVAIVEIRRGETSFVRWVFDDPALTRDLPGTGGSADHTMGSMLDENLTMSYEPGRRRNVRYVAGPGEDQLRVLVPLGASEYDEIPVTIGSSIELQPGFSAVVTEFAARSRSVTRPRIVPRHQRNRNIDGAGAMVRMVQLHINDPGLEGGPGGGTIARWLPFHLYAFDRAEEVPRRFAFQPSVVRLADGRQFELLFSRERMPLPGPVVLDDFRLTTHIGGFSGATTSIRDWTSVVRFGDGAGSWGDPVDVSVNAPQANQRFWYFQSQWDPPEEPRGPGDPGSAGLNYTVLGVGNREGVLLQLAGCCLSVLGMLYAFYVKPVIKRRRQQAVYAGVARAQADEAEAARSRPVREPVVASVGNTQPEDET